MANPNIDPIFDKRGKLVGYAVYPTGLEQTGETLDHANVKWAIENAPAGGVVQLKAHRKNLTAFQEFYFGGDSKDKSMWADNTVYLTQDVSIIGEKRIGVTATAEYDNLEQHWSAGVADEKGTTIRGGRVPFVVGLDPGKSGSDPNNPQLFPVSVTIKNIRFKEFYRCAIRIYASRETSVISDCSFVKYDQGLPELPSPPNMNGAFPLVADSWLAPYFLKAPTVPQNLSGRLEITNNFFGGPPEDSTMCNLVHVSNCNLTPCLFGENRIENMNWVGFSVFGNKGETRIRRNHITKKSDYVEPGFVMEGAGISAGFTPIVSPSGVPNGNIMIEENTLEIASVKSNGISIFLLPGQYYQPPAADPAMVRIRDNHVDMKVDVKKVYTYERAALACLGATSKSEWVKNTVKGEARYGIWVSDHSGAPIVGVDYTPIDPATLQLNPSGNEFRDNDLEKFTATKAQAFIGERVKKLQLLGNTFGGIARRSTDPNEPTKMKPPPVSDAVAGIRCKGSWGVMSGNRFENSAILGWNLSPYVGCIYLDRESRGNLVKYFVWEFPDKTVPPVEHQIFDDRAFRLAQNLRNKIVQNSLRWDLWNLWKRIEWYFRPRIKPPRPEPPVMPKRRRAA